MCQHGQAKPRRRRARRTAFWIVVVALGARAPLAVAAAPKPPTPGERTLELSWDAPRDCGDAAAVRRDVERVIGKSGEVRREVQVRGEVKRTAEGWSVTLLLVTEAGRSTRTLTAPSCRALTRASAVVIAFTMTEDEAGIEPGPHATDAISEGVDRPDSPPPRAETIGPPPKNRATIAPAPALPRTPRFGPTVGLFVRADAGTLPDIALGPGVLVGWHARSIFLEATLGWLAGQREEIVPPPERRATISHAEFAAFFARIAICPASPSASLVRGPLQILGCAGFGALETRVTGRPMSSGNTVEGWSGSAFLGPRLRFAHGWFAMSVAADAAIPFRRQDFVLLDRSGGALSVHRSSAVLVGISLGVELTFFQ